MSLLAVANHCMVFCWGVLCLLLTYRRAERRDICTGAAGALTAPGETSLWARRTGNAFYPYPHIATCVNAARQQATISPACWTRSLSASSSAVRASGGRRGGGCSLQTLTWHRWLVDVVLLLGAHTAGGSGGRSAARRHGASGGGGVQRPRCAPLRACACARLRTAALPWRLLPQKSAFTTGCLGCTACWRPPAARL